MQSKGSIQCRIGEFTVKTNQPADLKMQRGGLAILEYLENLIVARQVFDPFGVHTVDLQTVLREVKMLKNRLLRVDKVWEALTTQFQCFHQLIQNWAKSSTTAVMPRLTGTEGMQAAASLWHRAEFGAIQFVKIDPAWNVYSSGAGTEAGKQDEHPLSGQISSALTDRTTPQGAAKGDGKKKRRNVTAGFPNHVDNSLLCHSWEKGRDCPNGAQCSRYCYLTKAQDMYKKR
jgi:hypothetical protein